MTTEILYRQQHSKEDHDVYERYDSMKENNRNNDKNIMKGATSLWMLLMALIIVVAVVFMFPAISTVTSKTMDQAVTMQARHWSNEISNIVNEMQSAPDGFYNSLDIPRTGKFYIYNSMVRADFDGSNKHDSFFLQKLDSATKEWKSIVVKEDGAAIIDTAPIIVENTKTKAINFYKKDGKIIITTTSR